MTSRCLTTGYISLWSLVGAGVIATGTAGYAIFGGSSAPGKGAERDRVHPLGAGVGTIRGLVIGGRRLRSKGGAYAVDRIHHA